MAIQPVSTINIFFCSAPQDATLQAELETHLGSLRQLKQITMWSDRDISAGVEREQQIEAYLDAADIILILVSADFLSSDYWYNIAMARALQRHQEKKAIVLPILLRPVQWQDTALNKLQVLPTDQKAITRWENRDEAWWKVAGEIRSEVRALLPTQLLSPKEIALLSKGIDCLMVPPPREIPAHPSPIPFPLKPAPVQPVPVIPPSVAPPTVRPQPTSHFPNKFFLALIIVSLVLALTSIPFYTHFASPTSSQTQPPGDPTPTSSSLPTNLVGSYHGSMNSLALGTQTLDISVLKESQSGSISGNGEIASNSFTFDDGSVQRDVSVHIEGKVPKWSLYTADFYTFEGQVSTNKSGKTEMQGNFTSQFTGGFGGAPKGHWDVIAS